MLERKGYYTLQIDVNNWFTNKYDTIIKKATPARLHILEKMKEAIDKPQEAFPLMLHVCEFRIDPELAEQSLVPEEPLKELRKN